MCKSDVETVRLVRDTQGVNFWTTTRVLIISIYPYISRFFWIENKYAYKFE